MTGTNLKVAENKNLNVGEHLLNILKAALATAPFAGGIASLMSDYIPSSKIERLEKFTETIGKDLEHLQLQVNEAAINTDEFAYIFEACFKGVADNYQREKIQAFRAILVNSAISNDPVVEESQYFLNLVSSLTTLHLRILKFMAMPEEYLSEVGIPFDQVLGGFQDMFSLVFSGVDIEVVKMTFGDLYNNGFLTTDKSIFNTMTAGQGLDLLQGRVSELGNKFINFCTVENM